MGFNSSAKWLIQTPDRTEANNPPLYYKGIVQDIENRAAGAAQIVADVAARNAIPTGQLYPHKRVITLADGIEWKYLSGAWKAWESDWIGYGPATSGITPGATGFTSASYKYQSGDVLIRFLFAIGSSGVSIADTVTVPYPGSLLRSEGTPTAGVGRAQKSVADGGQSAALLVTGGYNNFLIQGVGGAPAVQASLATIWTWGQSYSAWAELRVRPA